MTGNSKLFYNNREILAVMELMRRPNGAFIASLTPDYSAMWIRDHLYITFAYWYIGEYEKLRQGIWLIFDLFKKYREKIESRLAYPTIVVSPNAPIIDTTNIVIHAKYNPDTLDEITTNDGWGHDQLDAVGLFLHIVADIDFKHIGIIRGEDDIAILKLLVNYLRSVEYWHRADNGMWEDCRIRHSSSIGAVVSGLAYLKKQRLMDVPDSLIKLGEEALNTILPFESRDYCMRHHHSHDCDAAQISLIWPYNVVVNPRRRNEIIKRIIDGHTTEAGELHKLSQTHGLNRFWGDDYYRSTEGEHRGISAEWPMFKFWLSIIFSQLHDWKKSEHWFFEGCKEIIDNKVPEAYQNGKPNNHTPLAWAHAISLIAWSKLPQEIKNKFFSQ